MPSCASYHCELSEGAPALAWVRQVDGIECFAVQGSDVRFMQNYGLKALQDFCGVLHRLIELFGVGRENVAIYHESSSRVAFNLAGRLYFNVNTFASLVAGQTMEYVDAYWYVTFCHELAHNVARSHDSEHEHAMEMLVALKLHDFYRSV